MATAKEILNFTKVYIKDLYFIEILEISLRFSIMND